jgi:hypothetical protein
MIAFSVMLAEIATDFADSYHQAGAYAAGAAALSGDFILLIGG